MTPSRRAFFSTPATALSAARVCGANKRVRLGIVGTGGRSSHLMREANECENVQWVAVCDAGDQRREKALELTGPGVQKYADSGRLLDRKDVHVEKPMTSQPLQGPPLMKAVRGQRRVLQTGVQQRGTVHFAEASQRCFDSGQIGLVHMVRTIWNNDSNKERQT